MRIQKARTPELEIKVDRMLLIMLFCVNAPVLCWEIYGYCFHAQESAKFMLHHQGPYSHCLSSVQKIPSTGFHNACSIHARTILLPPRLFLRVKS